MGITGAVMLLRGANGEATLTYITLRVTTAAAKLSLCLTRHANRDGHTMRSFESLQCGAACWQKTHRASGDFWAGGSFGVLLRFDSRVGSEGAIAAWPAPGASALVGAAHDLITSGGNTYSDRLHTMVLHLAKAKREIRERPAGKHPT